MKAPKVILGDFVIGRPPGKKEDMMFEIATAEWDTQYSQWRFNKDTEVEIYETQVRYWYDRKKNKWRKGSSL